MTCPNCAAPTVVEPVAVATAEGLPAEHMRRLPARADVERCPSCSWWSSPPRVPTDPHLLARTGGHGLTTEVP